MNRLSNYARGVVSRLPQLSWLPLFIIGILWLNGRIVGSVLYSSGGYLSLENWRMLCNMLGIALTGWLLTAFIPWRVARRIWIGVLLGGLLVMHLTDWFLVETYQMPFNDVIIEPLMATNPEEAQGFLTSMHIDWLSLLTECALLVLALTLSIALPYAIRELHKLSNQSRRFHCGVQWAVGAILLIVSISHVANMISHYNHNDPIYEILSSTERICVAQGLAQRQIAQSGLNYHIARPKAGSVSSSALQKEPHNVVIVWVDELYAQLMHCYDPQVDENTPLLDKLIDTGAILRSDSTYAASDNLGLSKAWTFSLCPKGATESWDRHPSIYGILREAGYNSYWVSNYPRVGIGLDVTPQLALDCDRSYHTNLRTGLETKTARHTYDGDVLKHLHRAEERPLVSTIHLVGSATNIWYRVPEDFTPFNRNTIDPPTELDGDSRDNLAQYYNLVSYEDYIFKEIIDYYAETPSVILFLSTSGAFGEWHPYRSDQIPKGSIGQVLFLAYVSPLMEHQYPRVKSYLEELCSRPFNLGDFAPQLCKLLGITYQPQTLC